MTDTSFEYVVSLTPRSASSTDFDLTSKTDTWVRRMGCKRCKQSQPHLCSDVCRVRLEPMLARSISNLGHIFLQKSTTTERYVKSRCSACQIHHIGHGLI
jgi:hypothetical protein